ncbi:MAG TPA: helix-turn-helix transcriptional regulator [Vicinamibacterales bacterium]|nr:helix-turn-helix transcriptional regulator [Vicinamibacterales bacterium]
MLLTVSEAADRLGVSYSTLKQWIYKGMLRTTRTAGGHHRVAESEVERLLGGQNRPPSGRRPKRRAAPIIVSISGRNQLRGIVEEIRTSGVLAQVRLRIGDQRLTSVITRDAIEELRLRRGDEALAIIKATEVMIAREGDATARRKPAARPAPPGRR